ncbi:bifunctional nuclease domain-containing protein [Chloroflexota bacterium]
MGNVEMIIHSINVALIDYQRAVVLKEKNGERYLPMWVDATKADAITLGLQNPHSPELLTHDFICSVISKLGAVLKYVVVDELTEENSHAKTFLEREGKVIEVDCSPSDAFATALRAETPIFVTEKILEKVGISTDEISKTDKSGREPRAKILVVDDNELYLKYVSDLLVSEGYKVDTAVGGIDALAKIKGNTYSLLLTGIRMPYMSGFEFYGYVQRIAPSLANKTIIISASINDEDAKEFLAENKLTNIAKPFNAQKLVDKVDQILTGTNRKS